MCAVLWVSPFPRRDAMPVNKRIRIRAHRPYLSVVRGQIPILASGLLLVLFAGAIAYYQFGPRSSHSPITARPNALMALPNEANTSSSRESDVVIPVEQLERLHLKIEPVTRHSIGA